MRPITRSLLFLLLVSASAVPMFGAVGADVTLPAAGFLTLPNDVLYRTEMVLTNHRDALQYVALSFVSEGYDQVYAVVPLDPKETSYLPSAGFPVYSPGGTNRIGAIRIRALTEFPGGEQEELSYDPDGQLEATAYIVAERGRGAQFSSTRQEVHGIPSAEYNAEQAVFLGARHDLGTGVYTNVGIVNMDPSETVTFWVRFQFAASFPVVVPPLSIRQVRLPGQGSGGRYVHIEPEWALTDEAPSHTTPWVAYTSTIDMKTGDAYSGIRVPSTTRYRHVND